jgi:hypothetical protein
MLTEQDFLIECSGMFNRDLVERFLLFFEDVFELRDLGVRTVHVIPHFVELMNKNYLHLFLVLSPFGNKEKTLVKCNDVLCQMTNIHLLLTVQVCRNFKTVLLLKLR